MKRFAFIVTVITGVITQALTPSHAASCEMFPIDLVIETNNTLIQPGTYVPFTFRRIATGRVKGATHQGFHSPGSKHPFYGVVFASTSQPEAGRTTAIESRFGRNDTYGQLGALELRSFVSAPLEDMRWVLMSLLAREHRDEGEPPGLPYVSNLIFEILDKTSPQARAEIMAMQQKAHSVRRQTGLTAFPPIWALPIPSQRLSPSRFARTIEFAFPEIANEQ